MCTQARLLPRVSRAELWEWWKWREWHDSLMIWQHNVTRRKAEKCGVKCGQDAVTRSGGFEATAEDVVASG